MPALSSTKVMHYPSSVYAGSRQFNNRGFVGGFPENEGATFDPLIGRKAWTRWPEDNFYEAVITDYNPSEGRHALVYDINTGNETWEWVDLKETILDGMERTLAYLIEGDMVSMELRNPSVVVIPLQHQEEVGVQ